MINSDKAPKELYTTEEVAKLTGMHYQTVRNYIKKGIFKAIKIGNSIRIPKEEINITTPQ